jgi:protein tyrosine phosphatase (PTP) superfamily phosphohydrolase (DUF442 family)
MRGSPATLVLLGFLVTSCLGQRSSVRTVRSGCEPDQIAGSAALGKLCGPEGPVRFSRVTPRLYRGGQPTAENLAWLRDLGISTVINLRREDEELRQAEQRQAAALGLKYFNFPFYGIFGADDAFLEAILAEMRRPENGPVYVHCKVGRDRTSLMVSAHLVLEHGKDPDRAWRQDVLGFGHDPNIFFVKIRDLFERMVAPVRKRNPGPPRREIEAVPSF